MAFKEIMWNLKIISPETCDSISEQLDYDKRRGFGTPGGYHGTKYYIPADAMIGGL